VTTSYEGERCPECGKENPHWEASTPTTDTWVCRACGYTWVITVEPPAAQTQTDRVEGAEIHG
jgi:transposase-like protein